MDIVCWMIVFILTFILLKKAKKSSFYQGDKDLTGKVVVVTGANSGIGFEAAVDFAKRNATVILGCRDEKRGMDAEIRIKQITKNTKVRYRQLDLGSLASVRKFVEVVTYEENSLYALVNNAGIFWVPFRRTQDGFEPNLGVNHLGHFLLTILLLPLLSKSEESRIVTVGSITYIFGNMEFQDLNYEVRKYNFLKAYCDSKLANLLMTSQMAKFIKNKNIRTYCVDPGVILTNIGNSSVIGNPVFRFLTDPIRKLFSKTCNEGAQTIIYCVCSDEVSQDSGCLYSECKKTKIWPSGLNEQASLQLWKDSIRLVKLEDQELNFVQVA